MSRRCCLDESSTSADLLPTLQTFTPIQSSPSFSHDICLTFLCFIGLSLFLLVVISPVFGVVSHVRNNLFKKRRHECSRFNTEFINYRLVCSVFSTAFVFKSFMHFVMFLFSIDVSRPYVTVGNTHVHIIHIFIFLFFLVGEKLELCKGKENECKRIVSNENEEK